MSYVGIIAARGRSGRTGLGQYTTKAAFSLAGRTLLGHQLDFFQRSGIERAIVIALPEHVRLLASLLSHEEQRRVAFIASDADDASGWAGTLDCARAFVAPDDEVLLVSCDNLHRGAAMRLEQRDFSFFTYTNWSRTDASPTSGPVFARVGDTWAEAPGKGFTGDFFSGYVGVQGQMLFDALDKVKPSARGEREFTSLLCELWKYSCRCTPYPDTYDDVADLDALARFHARALGSSNWNQKATIGAGVVLHDSYGRVFMTERADGLGWVFPGGLCDSGEAYVRAAIRELREEVGYTVREDDLRLLGVYPTTGKRGEPACSILFHARARTVLGDKFDRKEVKRIGWHAPGEVEDLTIPFDMVQVARDWFAGRELDVR